MELVEGDDLSQRIVKGAIPLDEALPIAKQIAEALEAAHEQGFIHRDLKPANIKIRSEGTVKVLDFGLAKAMEPAAGSSPSMSMSPTITTPAMTHAGMILGTAAYMSPEQARGTSVDKRTDIWAFGCVLFEMLAGRGPFARQTVSDSMAAILEREPDWTALPHATPALVQRLVARCLVKDRQQRLRDIGDARLQIDEALASPNAIAPPVVRRATARWLVLVLVLATAVAMWVVEGRRPVPQSAAPFPARFAVAAPSGYQLDPIRSQVAVSRDGRTVVFAASRASVQQIFVRDIDAPEVTLIPGTEGGFGPFFSPDGEWIGFFANQKMKKVLRSGGAPVSIADVSEIGGALGVWPQPGKGRRSSSHRT
jgi:serine/threonine-protein kinase